MLRFIQNKKKVLSKLKLKAKVSKSFAINNLKIENKLSFLNTEEEMRRYFNLVDWDKKEIEEQVFKNLNFQKQKYDLNEAKNKEFNEKDVLNTYKTMKEQLEKAKKEEFLKTNKEENAFELVNEFSIKNVNFYFLLTL